MTGLAGLELTSADGAQLRLTPQAREAAAESGATSRVRSTSSTAPRAGLPGKEEPVRDLQPGDVAALLVDRDQDVVAFGAQLRGERGQLVGGGDVAAEQADGGRGPRRAGAAASRGRWCR